MRRIPAQRLNSSDSLTQLTKEDEKQAGDEIEVRREDQDKINKFSRLHQRELALEEELKAKSVGSSISTERPQADSVATCRKRERSSTTSRPSSSWLMKMNLFGMLPLLSQFPLQLYLCRYSYKIGDAFFHVSLPVAQEMLGRSGARVERELREQEEKLEDIRAEMAALKVDLYSRFGKTINLEV
jgi:prefoldin subunit 4